MAVWNALLILSGLLLIALVGETYLRLANPFIERSIPYQFVDGVGLIRKPNAELRFANWKADNFVVSRTNSQGFLDREPVSPERAAVGCHIAFIGDSYVEAMEVPIADKFHVRLEEMAARELPHLNIAAQAYGITSTGQINQLPFYDEYALRMSPKLLVLVFFLNDFSNNSPALQSLILGVYPDKMPYMSAQRDEHETLKLRPPDPEYLNFRLPNLPNRWYESAWTRLVQVSYFAKWLDTKELRPIKPPDGSQLMAWADIIDERPCCSSLLDGWKSYMPYHISVGLPFRAERLPPVFEEALAYTAFGIEQFKRRADRDGAKLAILTATRYMGRRGDPQFDRISIIAEAHGIPVISDYDHILRQGYDEQDALWPENRHWNPTGHQWAAEAILEWLKENQEVCD